MTNRPQRKTRAQRLTFDRRVERVLMRRRQRWGAQFRQDMLMQARMNRARRMDGGFLAVMLDEIRRMR